MKKYLILFLLMISTFLTAQEELPNESTSKWQIGKGNFAFGTSLNFSKINFDNNDFERMHFYYFSVGSKYLSGNNLFNFNLRNIADFGIFSAGSNGTYLAYGLLNNSMLYISSDIATIGFSKDTDDTRTLGNTLNISYVYSMYINDDFNMSFAPYVSVPFFGMYKKDYMDNYIKYNFEQPIVWGINIVSSIESKSVFFDIMFNYNFSSEKTAELSYKNDVIWVSDIYVYSIALYGGKEFSDTLSVKGGFVFTSMNNNDVRKDGKLLQISLEQKFAKKNKFGVTIEYGLGSDFYENVTYTAVIGKTEFVF